MCQYFFWLLELCLSVHPFTRGYGTFWPLMQVHCCTECDIRSCLNTLQFLNRKKHSLKTVCTLLFCVQPCSIFWKHFATSLAVHNLTVINARVLLWVVWQNLSYEILCLQVDVASQVIGRKDMTSSIFDIWGEVSIMVSRAFKLLAAIPCARI